jgi:uncharacterized protein YqhQ
MIEEIYIIWSFSPRIGTLFKFKKKEERVVFCVYMYVYTHPNTQFSFFHHICCGTFFGLVFLLLLFILLWCVAYRVRGVNAFI